MNVVARLAYILKEIRAAKVCFISDYFHFAAKVGLIFPASCGNWTLFRAVGTDEDVMQTSLGSL